MSTHTSTHTSTYTSTYTEITSQLADQWVSALKNAEETVAKVSASATTFTDSLPTPPLPVVEPFAKLNEALREHLPQPSEVVQANFEFTTRLLAAQRDLTLRILEVASTAAEAAPAADATDQG